jgi:hypothetical protein
MTHKKMKGLPGWLKGVLIGCQLLLVVLVLFLISQVFGYNGTCLTLGLPGIAKGGPVPCSLGEYLFDGLGFSFIVQLMVTEYPWALFAFLIFCALLGHAARKKNRKT